MARAHEDSAVVEGCEQQQLADVPRRLLPLACVVRPHALCETSREGDVISEYRCDRTREGVGEGGG